MVVIAFIHLMGGVHCLRSLCDNVLIHSIRYWIIGKFLTVPELMQHVETCLFCMLCFTIVHIAFRAKLNDAILVLQQHVAA